ncbi:MAG: hypothetical protein IJ587_04190 [Synergistaceae bacterium]|nr:hypothetical protein [Synergistaceae bacterium]
MILTCNIAYAADAFDIHIQYAKQIWKYMDQVVSSNKPRYLGYEYYGPDEGDFGFPEQIYSLVYKTSTTSVVVNYYDKQLKQPAGAPYFITTNLAHSIGKIKVGGSVKSLAKSIFVKQNKKHYQSFYDGHVINIYCNNKGIITSIEWIDEAPIASTAMEFIKGKRKANLK